MIVCPLAVRGDHRAVTVTGQRSPAGRNGQIDPALTPVDRRNPVRELAAPRAVGQIGQLALLATDLVLLGRLGATALGAGC
jgi:hypothetical protein